MQIDGNLVDMATIVVGISTTFISPCKRIFSGEKPLFIRDEVIFSLLNGTAIVPFFLMILSVFSSDVLHELVASSRISLAIGGGE